MSTAIDHMRQAQTTDNQRGSFPSTPPSRLREPPVTATPITRHISVAEAIASVTGRKPKLRS
jgi:hypothetical protein